MHDDDENNVVSSLIQNRMSKFWNGLRYTPTEKWTWSDGTPFNYSQPLQGKRTARLSVQTFQEMHLSPEEVLAAIMMF